MPTFAHPSAGNVLLTSHYCLKKPMQCLIECLHTRSLFPYCLLSWPCYTLGLREEGLVYLHSSGRYSQNSISLTQGAPCAMLHEQFHAFVNTPQCLGPCGSHGSWNLPGQASAALPGPSLMPGRGLCAPRTPKQWGHRPSFLSGRAFVTKPSDLC